MFFCQAQTDTPVYTPSAPVAPDTTERTTPELPKLYVVLLHNDNSSSPLFVVEVLCEVFNLNSQRSSDIMMQAHTTGVAVVGAYTRDVAETKVAQAMAKAQFGRNMRSPTSPCELAFSFQPE